MYGRPRISKTSFSLCATIRLSLSLRVIPELSNFRPLGHGSALAMGVTWVTHFDFACNLKSRWNMMEPVHPTTVVQYTSGTAKIRSSLRLLLEPGREKMVRAFAMTST